MKRRKTLQERATDGVKKLIGRADGGMIWEYERSLWLAGYRAGKKEGKAEAMEACGWGSVGV